MAKAAVRGGHHAKALDLMSRAARLAHNHARVHGMMGGYAFQIGYPELAIPFLQRAVALDPLSAVHQLLLGRILYFSGRYAEAETRLRDITDLLSGAHEEALVTRTRIRIHQNDLESATELAARISPGPDRDHAHALLAILQGQPGLADDELKRLAGLPPAEASARMAEVFAVQGDHEKAFRHLHFAGEAIRGLESGDRDKCGRFTMLIRSPFLESLHADPRWDEWLADVSRELELAPAAQVIRLLRDHLVAHPQLYPPEFTRVAGI